jgi:uncharacterized protein YukE
MGQAEQLQQAAQALQSTAGKYNTTSTDLQGLLRGLSAMAMNLTSGPDGWTGSAFAAFNEAWRRSKADGWRIGSSLTGASQAFTTLAQVIETNLPAIRALESLEAQKATFHPHSRFEAEDFAQGLTEARNSANGALQAITTAVTSVEGLSENIGFCSEGTPTLTEGSDIDD